MVAELPRNHLEELPMALPSMRKMAFQGARIIKASKIHEILLV
jgi:hypothetical protein